MENKNRFLIPAIFSIVGVVLTFLLTLNLAGGIAEAQPAYDYSRVFAGTIQTDVRSLLYIFLPIYLIIFLALSIPIALLVIVFNKISRTATYELGIFSTGEGFDTIKLVRRAIVPSLFALSFAEIFLNLVPDWLFFAPSIEVGDAGNFLRLYDPLQTIIGALLAMVAGIVIFAPTWILNDSGVVTQVKSHHMSTRRCPDTEGIGRWFSNLFGGFAILAYPLTTFYRFFYVRFIVYSVPPTPDHIFASIFWVVGIPLLVMSFVMPFVILNEFGLGWTTPKIQGFARKLGAKDVKPKSLMLEMLEVQDQLNDQPDDEIDPDSTETQLGCNGRSSLLYKFGNKKNREDVIALRWPKACLSCGVDTPETVDPRHAIVGLFHVDKKTSRSDRRHTQVLLKLPGFFYMCETCTSVINNATENPPKNLEKLVETLHESPWMEFIELEKSGHVILPDGFFKEKLQDVNPDAWFKTKKNPMVKLKQVLSTEE